MKKRVILILMPIATLVSVFLLAPWKGSSPLAPLFVPKRMSPVGVFNHVHYNWGALRPFVDDKVWIFGTRDGTNNFYYLYDLHERMILGELKDGGDVAAINGDGTKLLLSGRGKPATDLRERLLAWLAKLFGRRFNANRTESFWVLDLRANTAQRVGSFAQYSGVGSRWYSSPGLRYSCNSPSTENGQAFILFDFEHAAFERVPVPGQLRGWWDEQHVLLQAPNLDFITYDVTTRNTAVLFRTPTVQRALAELGLPENPSNLVAFLNWNGREYDCYFTEKDYEFRALRSFLLEADRSSTPPGLKLLYREVQFQWGGHLDADATHLLFQGESGAVGRGGDGAVYLRNLADESVSTLVLSDNKGQYAIPRFYGNEVIYFRNRMLWRIGLDGSNNAPLFPRSEGLKNP